MTGGAADQAERFAAAMTAAANMEFGQYMEQANKTANARQKQEYADSQRKTGFQTQRNMLGETLQTGGVESMQKLLYGIKDVNETLYSSMMSTYPMMEKLGASALTYAEA